MLLLISFLGAQPSRQWVATPKVSFGAMEGPVNIDIPKYKPDTVEYKIIQVALDMESVFPYDIQYESTYLSNTPQTLRESASKRNTNYIKIAAAKKAGKATENDATGLLDASASATPTEIDVINTENTDRKELYELISKFLKLSSTDKDKVAKLYAQAIKYQKYYALSSEPVFTIQQDPHILTSTVSIYKHKTVWDGLINVLNEEKFILEKSDINQAEGTLTPKYKCGTEPRTFVIRLCTIKDKKLSSCKNAPKDESLYSSSNHGTLIWIEGAKDKDKTLVLTGETNESEEIKYCKGEDKKFDILEKLSSKLIAADPNKPVVPSVPPKPIADKNITQAPTTNQSTTTTSTNTVIPENKDNTKKENKDTKK